MHYEQFEEVPDAFNDDGGWEPLVASSLRGTEDKSLVIRKDGIKLSEAFSSGARLLEMNKRFVLITVNGQSFRIRLQFLTAEEMERVRRSSGALEHAFKLHHDGGSSTLHRKRNGTVVQNAAALRRVPWLHSASDKVFNLRRRFAIEQEPGKQFTYLSQIAPGFLEKALLSIAAPQSNRLGFYALADAAGACLYIGQGIVAERLRSHAEIPEMKDASAMWTYCASPASAKFVEAHYLHAFRAKNGRLPQWNRMGGRSLASFA